jgi:hypothetical protein
VCTHRKRKKNNSFSRMSDEKRITELTKLLNEAKTKSSSSTPSTRKGVVNHLHSNLYSPFMEKRGEEFAKTYIELKGDGIKKDPDYIASLPVTDARVMALDLEAMSGAIFGKQISAVYDTSSGGFGTASAFFKDVPVHYEASLAPKTREFRSALNLSPAKDGAPSISDNEVVVMIDAIHHHGLSEDHKKAFSQLFKGKLESKRPSVVVIPVSIRKGRKTITAFTELIRGELKASAKPVKEVFCIRRIHAKTAFFYLFRRSDTPPLDAAKALRVVEKNTHDKHLADFKLHEKKDDEKKSTKPKRQRAWHANAYWIDPNGKKEKKKGKGKGGKNKGGGGGGLAKGNYTGGNINLSVFGNANGSGGGGKKKNKKKNKDKPKTTTL